jgi:hypothetical protein
LKQQEVPRSVHTVFVGGYKVTSQHHEPGNGSALIKQNKNIAYKKLSNGSKV